MKISVKLTMVTNVSFASLLTVLILTVIQSMTASAADAEKNYAIWGEGSTSCFSYTKARTAEDDSHFKSYVRGYLTAFNTLTADTYNITGAMSLPEIMTWLDNYCDGKGIESVDRALHMLIEDVGDQRQKKPVQKGISEGWGK